MKSIEIQMDEILKTFDIELNENVEKIARKVSRETANQLRSSSPKKPGGGEYAAGWTCRKDGGVLGAGYVVYNKSKPGLTHLLEHGHETRNQYGTYKRTPAKVHIKPAEEAAKAKFEKLMVDAINRG